MVRVNPCLEKSCVTQHAQYVMLNTSTKNIYSNLLLKNKRVSVEDPGSGWHIPNFVLKKISSIRDHKLVFSKKKKNECWFVIYCNG